MDHVWKGLLTAAVLILPPALAHDTVTAGNARIEFHTDANELLRVEADTTVSFTLTVKEKQLRAADCRCTLLLYSGQPSPRVKPSVILLKADPDDVHAIIGIITVMQPGRYSLVLDGKPAQAGAFEAFRITYQVQAARDVFNAPPLESQP